MFLLVPVLELVLVPLLVLVDVLVFLLVLCTCCYNTNVISDCIPLDKSVHYFTIFVYFVVLFLNLLVHFQAKLNSHY